MTTPLALALTAMLGIGAPTAPASYRHAHLRVASVARAAQAAAPETVIQDDAVLLHGSDAQVSDALDKIKALGIDRVRVTAGWSVIAPEPDAPVRPDFDATDPAAYPPGNWNNLDRIVRMANAVGVKVMIDIAFWAPRWATQSPPSQIGRLRTDIDPQAFAQFAAAVATRYSGSWAPPAPPAGQPEPEPEPSPDESFLSKLFGGSQKSPPPPPPPVPAPLEQPVPLPAVDIFTLWNEPNFPGFVLPQWTREDRRLVAHSADVYRAMVDAAYPAVKAIDPAARVLVGATSSMGSSTPGRSGVPPLAFLRRLACVDTRWHPIATGACAAFTTLPGDGWSHHPYSLDTLPDQLPIDRDKLPVASTAELLDALRRLAAMGRIAPADQDLYLTEYGYETSPPDPQAKFGPGRQAQLLSWAEYIATRDPRVKMWPQFQLVDRPGGPAGPRGRLFGDWQTGLYYDDWSPKPAAAVYRTPTFAGCLRGGGARGVLVWGRLRGATDAAATLVVQAPGGPAATRIVARAAQLLGGRELLRVVPYVRGARYRLLWTAAGRLVPGPAVAPVGCTGASR
jgi:hypothetical protein